MHEIVIGCDEAAVNLKRIFIKLLQEMNISVEDVGVRNDEDKTAYPLVASAVCKKIIASGYTKRGILICGTGIGMCIAANKFRGIRAAVCHDIYSAQRSILSNNGNIACFGERVIGTELAKAILREWVKLEFKNGPSTPKVEEIVKVEWENFK
ncbi:ribose 5-phosphate isomerase B [Leadbettera azotonutricia]|uniref:Ribose-5-phosphate isomerase B n=1 Tax=Leadbettera azotonutricia (strain ATCC BAA-888 / DSM 13862 / ZAS-9) TaxID=545695 RepID=F5YG99_LEAAZ|nr:ribose 5-phosphate isomerase B [Leadbettera azotonutricia]AEF82595.1 ribose-5-phosphate isomerase B [Leadbettera azotonutricia ZAS-9]